MARLSFVIAFALALSLVSASTYYPSPCYKYCKFRFCDYRVSFKIGHPIDKPFTHRICSKYGKHIGHVDETGEAFIRRYHKFVPISKYAPYGLKQRFSPSFFKSYGFKYNIYSGIGHETPQQNQLHFLHNKCVVVPLRAYQVLNSKKHVIDNVHPRGYPLRDCVAFTTRVY